MMKKIAIILVLILISLACTLPGSQPVESEPTNTETGIIINTFTSSPTSVTQTPTQTLTKTYTPEVNEPDAPTITSTITLTLTPGGEDCNIATFIQDVTVPDGSQFIPGEPFTKTWKIKNIGTCTWTTDYKIVFDEADQMGGPDSFPMPEVVPPEGTVSISVDLVAPATPGDYTGYWRFESDAGLDFGLSNDDSFYVDIEVITPNVVYDFTDHMCDADWKTTAVSPGTVTCPGAVDDSRGSVSKLSFPEMETGDVMDVHGMFTHPTWGTSPAWSPDQMGGWIQGVFPAFVVQDGTFFKADVGCKLGADSCDVNFHVQIKPAGESWYELTSVHKGYDGTLHAIVIDLSPVEGETVEIMLQVDANNTGGLDQAVWVYPRLEK